MKIKLDRTELDICEYIARKRQSENRNANVVDTQKGKQSPIKIDIQGVKSEYGFAKLHNLFLDFSCLPRSGSADGVTKNGYRYDIKSTDRKNGNLICTLKVNPDVDIYVLAYVNEDEIEYVGWAAKEQMIKTENIKDLGHGDTYFLHRDKLNKFE